MKEFLVKHLVCPACRGELALTVSCREGKEIAEGRLPCRACPMSYPITRGIPRFVPTDAYAGSFSYQWTIHRTTQVDSIAGHSESKQAFSVKTGLARQDLQGRLVLDVGCGTGRYAEVAADLDADVVGVDLSYAIDAAYRNMGRRERVHFVQADVFQLPFREATFDAAYSIGVLHHTPSTREAFLQMPPLVKTGGSVAIWVYKWDRDFSRGLDRLRPLTTRLPKPMLYAGCWIGVPILHALAQVPGFRRISRWIPTSTQGRGLAWDVLDTFDLYSPQYQWKHDEPEVRRWFEEASLTDVIELEFPVSFRGRKPTGWRQAQLAAGKGKKAGDELKQLSV